MAASITVLGAPNASATIVNGDITPSMADSTDFNVMGVSSGFADHTFVIANPGDALLNLTGAKVTITGANAGDFTIQGGIPDSVAAAGAAPLQIRFDPSASGLRQATVTITSDAPGSPIYTFSIQGAGLDTVTTASGLQYAVTTPGTGGAVTAGSNVLVNYTGWLTDGTKFDSSLNPGRYPFEVNGVGAAAVIAGWNEGLIGMQVGEHRTLIIPPELAYGVISTNSSIPDNATLIFDVEMLQDDSQVQMRGGLSYGTYIFDSQQVTTVDAHSNFGNVALAGGVAEWKFGVVNFNGYAVNFLGTPQVVISGPNASDFTVTTQLPTSIPANTVADGPGLGQFAIKFDPSGDGVRTAVVTIITDDPNEASYRFTITGTGVPNTLTGAIEDTAFTITYATLYKAVYGVTAPAGAPPFLIKSVDSGTLNKTGVAVTPNTTLLSPGQSVVWKGALNANRTQNAFTVQAWNGTAGTGPAMPVRVEVTPAADPLGGAISNIVLHPSVTLQTQTLDLTTMFTNPDVTGSVLKFTTAKGTFYVDTFANTPNIAANIISYATANSYDNSVLHNATPGSLVQGGAYYLNASALDFITTNAAVNPEAGYSNVRGTISIGMASWDWNGALARFAVNTANNSGARDGSYTVFGEVMGKGMTVIDAIAALPKANLYQQYPDNYNPDFTSVPVNNGNWTTITDVSAVPSLTFRATSNNAAVGVSVTGGTLTLNIPANATGGATITVTATDVLGRTVTRTFAVMLPVVTVAATDAAAAETAAGVRPNLGVFTVTRTGPITAPLTVQYNVAGSATSGLDFTALVGSVTIPAGKASATFTVAPLDDAVVEAPETVTVTLTDVGGTLTYAVGAAATATVNIASNDRTTVNIAALAPATASETPGANVGTFRISRVDTIDAPLTVNFTRAGGARTLTDYTLRLAGSGTTLTANSVTIPAGVDHVDVELVAVNDALVEVDELATLTLATSTAYIKGTASASITILDNEPRVSIAAINQAAEPNTPGMFTITRTGPTTQPLTVKLTRTGTATSGVDFVALPLSIVIPAGAVSADIYVQPLADTLLDPRRDGEPRGGSGHGLRLGRHPQRTDHHRRRHQEPDGGPGAAEHDVYRQDLLSGGAGHADPGRGRPDPQPGTVCHRRPDQRQLRAVAGPHAGQWRRRGPGLGRRRQHGRGADALGQHIGPDEQPGRPDARQVFHNRERLGWRQHVLLAAEQHRHRGVRRRRFIRPMHKRSPLRGQR